MHTRPKAEEKGKAGLGIWFLLFVLALIWGSSFILMKRGLFDHGRPVFSPLQVAATRLAIAWLVLSPLLFKHARLLPANWRALFVSGFFGNGLPAILFTVAQTRVGSAVAGVINSLSPLFTLVIGVLLYRSPVRMVHVMGVLLGLAGAAGLILIGQRVEGVPGWYAGCAVLATVCYGISANVVKKRLHAMPPEAIAALAISFVGPVATVLVFSTGVPQVVVNDPAGWRALAHVAPLAVLSSALALVLWNRLIQLTSALAASTVTYLMPIVAIGWGVLDGELITGQHMIMIALILGGVVTVHLADRLRR